MYTAATGMDAQTLRIDTIANNLANANTTGFKKSQVDFAELMYLTRRRAGGGSTSNTETPTGLQVGSGVFPVSTLRIFTDGVVENTSGELDMAITGDGFFQVETPTGEVKYTRDGNFRRDAEGVVVTSQGYPLYPQLSLPTDVQSVSIGSDGTVSILNHDGSRTSLGQIQLADFRNPAGLSSEGGNLLAETQASGPPITGTPGYDGFGELKQGYLEKSNVEVVTELVDLIVAQRTYELNSKVVKAGDRVLQSTNYIAG
jgi:flagellar basal-body rod protein FlgG